MSNIDILNGDFEILFDDETVGSNAVAGLRLVRRKSGASATVYTTVALYSAIAEAVDDFIAMGFKNPMLPVTPNAFTMENGFFIPRSSTEYLKEGAISAIWGTAVPDNTIRSIQYDPSGGTGVDFVAGDIGRQVVGGTTGDTGTLLDFEVLPGGTALAWIRPDDPATDLFDNATETLSCVADSGAGNNAALAVSTTGNSVYSSIQAIGAVPTATEVYIYQDDELDTSLRNKMTDSTGGFQWWATDSTVSLGIIDILIRVQRDSISIGDGDVEVFSRRYTSLYDNFRLNVAAGGRSALPLASAPDINNTTGYRRVTEVGATGTGPFVVGEIANEAVSGASVVITAVGGTTATPILQYYLVGTLTDLFGSGAQTLTGVTSGATMTTAAPVANLLGPTDSASGQGGTVTITMGTTTFDHDGDATAEPYSVTIDAQSNVVAAKVYERIKYVCRRGGNETDLFGAGVKVPGESYRGLEAQINYNSPSGTFTQGDDITGASGYTARVISVNTTDTYIMVTDQQTSLDAVVATNVLTDESADTVTAEAPINAITNPKASPFGTFTGTVVFGARGILFLNPAGADTQNYILIDDNGVIRTPPNTVSITINNTVALDRVLAVRDTGVSGVIDKDQFGGLAAASGAFNGLADLVIRVAGSIDTEVPPAGYVRIVATGVQEEHRYRYASRTTGALGEFTLVDVNEGTGITTPSSTQLIDTTATFLSAPVVQVGDLIRNTTATKLNHIWEVTNVVSTTTLDVVPLYGPLDATQDWDAADTYEINHLIGRDHAATPADYGTSDDVFDTIIDTQAVGNPTINTLIKTPASNFGIVVNVRQGKVILPFTQNQTVGDTGASVTVVRTPDTIAV